MTLVNLVHLGGKEASLEDELASSEVSKNKSIGISGPLAIAGTCASSATVELLGFSSGGCSGGGGGGCEGDWGCSCSLAWEGKEFGFSVLTARESMMFWQSVRFVGVSFGMQTNLG
jgi:hypothetical protein